MISGRNFTNRYLDNLGIFGNRFSINDESFSEVYRVMKHIKGEFVVGFGGGRVLDISKMVAYLTQRKLILIPTAPTHDGLISKNSVLITNGSKKSFPTKFPQKVIIPKDLWESSGDLKKFGEMDVLANIVALEDVSLATEDINFKPETEYMKLSMMAVKYILDSSIKDLALALLLSGLAMEKSSRYCSGSEHELEKILTKNFGKKYYHGQLVGTSMLLASKVYEKYSTCLRTKKLFIDPKELYYDIFDVMRKKDLLVYAMKPLKERRPIHRWLKEASRVRPERYTLWNRLDSKNIKWKKIIEEVMEDAKCCLS
ncbi:MAG: iron-containing alcohol dehydrogenase [Candidatus Aenigmarchaeota archaeon]|nr:iron-containing alcohol dehydrogenase [Candidatus Aenigmarchaeota archaeon]